MALFNKIMPALGAALLFWCAGCAHFKAVMPDGFARYRGESVFRAVSPDGIVFKVHHTANKPYAELPFWQEALSTRMQNAGYTLIDSSKATISGCPAFFIEVAAPLGNDDESYLIAVILDKKQLIIAEAAGEAVKFRNRKDAVVEAIKKISF
jgi:hypothetical protein